MDINLEMVNLLYIVNGVKFPLAPTTQHGDNSSDFRCHIVGSQ